MCIRDSFRDHSHPVRRAHIVQGLAFGDEGKGTMVDYLCREYDAPLVVRYNGGPQGTRNVVQPDGRHHGFRQFGSGMFLSLIHIFIISISAQLLAVWSRACHSAC